MVWVTLAGGIRVPRLRPTSLRQIDSGVTWVDVARASGARAKLEEGG